MCFRKGKNGQKNGITGTSGLLSCSSTKQTGYSYCIYIALYLMHMLFMFCVGFYYVTCLVLCLKAGL